MSSPFLQENTSTLLLKSTLCAVRQFSIFLPLAGSFFSFLTEMPMLNIKPCLSSDYLLLEDFLPNSISHQPSSFWISQLSLAFSDMILSIFIQLFICTSNVIICNHKRNYILYKFPPLLAWILLPRRGLIMTIELDSYQLIITYSPELFWWTHWHGKKVGTISFCPPHQTLFIPIFVYID
jgi:hypothetical protein